MKKKIKYTEWLFRSASIQKIIRAMHEKRGIPKIILSEKKVRILRLTVKPSVEEEETSFTWGLPLLFLFLAVYLFNRFLEMN